MVEKSGDSSQEEKPGGRKKYDGETRNRWVNSGLALGCFLTLQTLFLADVKDSIPLTISLLAFAVALPLNILLVLNTYAENPLPGKVRDFLGGIAYVGTFLGVGAAFWHASWVGGVVFAVVLLLEIPVALKFFN